MTAGEIVKYYTELPKGKEIKEIKKRINKKLEFNVTFVDDRDFIIEKIKEGKKDTLVFLYPQFVIKHENGTIENITEENFKSFLGQSKVKVNNNFIDELSVDKSVTILRYYNDKFYKPFFEQKLASINYFRIIDLKSTNRDFYLDLARKVPGVLVSPQKYSQDFIEFVDFLHKYLPEMEEDFCNKYIRSSMNGIITRANPGQLSVLATTGKQKLLNCYRTYGNLINDYFCFELYKQGFDEIKLSSYVRYIERNPENPFPKDLLCPEYYYNSTIDKLYRNLKEYAPFKTDTVFMDFYKPESSEEFAELLFDFGFMITKISAYNTYCFFGRNKVNNEVSMFYFMLNYNFAAIGKNKRTRLTETEKQFGNKLFECLKNSLIKEQSYLADKIAKSGQFD